MPIGVYAVRSKNRDILNNSSSGGAFTVLSDAFIETGNAVLCAGYNFETDRTEFRMVLTKQERDVCRGSMYMQSFVFDAWIEALKWLKDNDDKKLIFFGLGCQAAAFLEVCKKKGVDDRVTIVDIVCHGVPSPMLWKDYISRLKSGGKLNHVTFKDKRNGWNKPVSVARIDNNEVSVQKWRRTYSARVMLRPSCASCPYTSIERKTDITIGDFWHIEDKIPDFYDELGTSLFLIHTNKGMELFDRIKESVDFRESNETDCRQPNLERPTSHAIDRDIFWREYHNNGIDFVTEKYGTYSIRMKIQRRILKLFKR